MGNCGVMMGCTKILAVKARKKSGGFSLIEVAIALIIIGILMVPAIQMYNQYQIDQIKVRSDEHLGVISRALQKFVVKNGRYPRPAEGNIAGGAAGEGSEIAVGAITPCAANMTTVCETVGLPADTIYIGTVPFAALGLPKSFALDGYSNRFTYAVTRPLTEAANFTDGGGKIQFLDQSGGNKTGTTSNVHYVLVSHGPNGSGTTTNAGVLRANCAGLGQDLENCDHDGVFNSNFATINVGAAAIYDRFASDVPGAGYFDDYTYGTTTTSADIWTPSPNLATPNLFNRNAGNIRVGTWSGGALLGQSVPAARLDVAGGAGNRGDLRATQVNVNRICSFTETGGVYTGCLAPVGAGAPQKRVFTPTIIGGTPALGSPNTSGNGIFCGNNRGMSGIAEADERCSNLIPAGTITVDGSCAAAGVAGRRIVGGVLFCESP